MKKFIYIILCLFMIVGCANKEEPIEIIESKEPFVVQVFYSKVCGHCKKLREDLVPLIQTEFGEQVTIEEYDIDDENAIHLYDSYFGLYDEENKVWDQEGLLEGVPGHLANYERFVPVVVVGDMYAFMGYEKELNRSYIQDIHLALQHRRLSSGDVSESRWEFKDEEVQD